MGGAGVGLAFPYFAVEPDAAELTGNHHALSTVQRGRNRIGVVGVFEPACEALPLGCGVANKADVEASVGGVGLRRKPQSRTDQGIAVISRTANRPAIDSPSMQISRFS